MLSYRTKAEEGGSLQMGFKLRIIGWGDYLGGPQMQPHVFFFLKFIYFIFGCVGSLPLRTGFLQLWRAGATLRCSDQASHCSGFSCCGAWALGSRASVVVARRL